jgi:hypothetical protein
VKKARASKASHCITRTRSSTALFLNLWFKVCQHKVNARNNGKSSSLTLSFLNMEQEVTLPTSMVVEASLFTAPRYVVTMKKWTRPLDTHVLFLDASLLVEIVWRREF